MEFLILSLAVFFVWIAIGRPILGLAFGNSNDLARHLIMCAVVLLMAWFAQHFSHPTLYLCLAIAGAVALFQGGLLWFHSYRDTDQAVAVQRRTARRTPPAP